MATPESSSSPPVIDKRRQPPGVMPRHLQTWVLLGLTALMVIVLLLSSPARQSQTGPAVNPVLATVDPNAARIQEYERRLDEQARRLAGENAELELAKRALRSASGPEPADRPHGSAPDQSSDIPAPRDPLQQEQQLREVRSRFADPLVLTTRPLQPQTTAMPHPDSHARNEDDRKNTSVSGQAEVQSTRRYRLPEGTLIEAVLTNRLDGAFTGPVNALITTGVYTPDGQHLLIPAGSRALGDAHPVTSVDQQRLALGFHRLVLPDEHAISLDRFQGLDQVGDVGLRDQVNHHYVEVFGASLAVGTLGGLAQANARYGADMSGADAYRQGAASSFGQSAAHILDRYLNRLPSVTIREGHRLRIYLANDLELPEYSATAADTSLNGSTS